MLIKKSEAIKHENSPTCTVWEHNHPSENLGYATALINGRYPPEKQAVNLKSEEIVFVISGSGVIHSKKGDFELNPKDSYYLEKNEKYWIEGDNLLLGLINSPKWTIEQYKIVD